MRRSSGRLGNRSRYRLCIEQLEGRWLFSADSSAVVSTQTTTNPIGVPAKVAYTEDSPPILLAGNAGFWPSADLAVNGSFLKVTVDGDSNPADRLDVHEQGTGSGQLDIFDNRFLLYDGKTFGSYTVAPPPLGKPYVYKVADGRPLHAYISYPPAEFTGPRPTMVLLHGGGWSSGAPATQNPHAEYFASRGMITVLVEYRFVDPGNSDAPVKTIQDAKSAIRWLRANARGLGIHPHQIATMGFSAGGHLAAATGTIDGFDDPTDNLNVSSKPNAVLLISGIISNAPGEFGYYRVRDRYQEFSPAHNVSADDPPLIGFWGSEDSIVSQQAIQDFKQKMDAAGVRMDLHLYDGQDHGFPGAKWDNPFYYDVMRKADRFLSSLGWLQGPPTIAMPAGPPPITGVPELTVHFASQASQSAVQALLRNITFRTPRADAGMTTRTVTYRYTDAHGTTRDVDRQTLNIRGFNDAPILKVADDVRLNSITEDATNPRGTLIETLLEGRVDDRDPHARQGIAIVVAETPQQGKWQYSRDNGSSWKPLGNVAYTRAKLLPADGRTLVRFFPGTHFHGFVSLRYRAWDQTRGQAETYFDLSQVTMNGEGAFSQATQTASIQVRSVNDAPQLKTAADIRMAAVPEDAINPSGTLVRSLLAGQVSDADWNALQGIAVIAAAAQGRWEFTLDGGETWQALGAVSQNNARLLPANDLTRVRFLPARNFVGTVQMWYRAWDRTQGKVGGVFDLTSITVGGSSAFSAWAERAELTVQPVNDAPLLNASYSPQLKSIDQGASDPPGTSVAWLVQSAVSDVDAGAKKGIAVFQAGGYGQGVWRFSLNGGTTWQPLGPLSNHSARLLPADDRTLVRFVPNAGFTGEVRLYYRAWDQTMGTVGNLFDLTSPGAIGATGAFSTSTDFATLTVRPAGTTA